MVKYISILKMNRKWSLYKHTSPSGKVYIGITSKSPEIRWGKNGIGYKRQSNFYNAILKYGWDNIRHEILFSNLSEFEAKHLEYHLVDLYKKRGIAYNAADGGGVGTSGYKWTKEQLSRKIIRDMKGENNPNYGNHKIAGKNNFMYGKTHTEEVRRKISLAATGRTHKMPDSQKTILLKIHSKPVTQLDLNNNIVAKFSSSIAAARFYGKGVSTANHIAECCKGKRKKCLNYKWIYNYDQLYKHKANIK